MFSSRVKRAREQLQAAGGDARRVNLAHLTPDERELALRTFHLPDDVDLHKYCEGWVATQQRLAMPSLRGYLGDLLVMLFQPEILGGLLGFWKNPPWPSAGPRPAYSGSKAVMLVAGALGLGSHIDNNVEFLSASPEAQDVLGAALETAAVLAEIEPEPFRLAKSTDSVLRHLPMLAKTLGRLAMRANVLMKGTGDNERVRPDTPRLATAFIPRLSPSWTSSP